MRIIFIVMMSLFVFQMEAQKVVMLHKSNGQQRAFYGNQPLQDAYDAASNEDTIYLPGGTFVIPTIDKRLTIYGAGHYPDSTQATGKTIIANSFYINSNADSFHLEGVDINGSISVNSNVNYLLLKHNSFISIDYSIVPVSSNSRIEGNVIRGSVSATYAANLLLVNNIIAGQLISTTNGDVIRNNIFLINASNYTLNNCFYTLFENNIFLNTLASCVVFGGSDYNTFSNNVFTITPTIYLSTFTNNYTNVDTANLFVHLTNNLFTYSDNYHLKTPGTYVGADATECGIYGGLFGYKEGAVPANPHIRQKTIAATTDVNGQLNVNITVAAQDK